MTVTARYNFVPLSEHVCRAEDIGLRGPPSQDEPILGGLSGCLPFTIFCRTPLLICAPDAEDGKKIKRFLHTPDGRPIIPGSSLRGMIRNVMEIACFGRFHLVDNRRFGVRDLSPTAQQDYRDRISERIDGAFAPKSRAGWLQRVNGTLTLFPCAFARIDHSDLDKIGPGFARNIAGLRGDTTREQGRMAKDVEGAFTDTGHTLDRDLWVEDTPSAHMHNGKTLRYRKALREYTRGYSIKSGTLVFSGLPSSRKHMEFFFFDRQDNGVEVSSEVWRKFIDVHEEQEKSSETWGWRKQTLDNGGMIPVFWLGTDAAPGAPTAIGLVMMFKLPADNTTHDLIRHSSPDHLNADIIDLPTRIFGRIHENGGQSFRGRVSFGYAELKGDPDAIPKDKDSCNTVLGAPKPSFVPAYVRQRDFGHTDGKALQVVGQRNGTNIYAQYRSYMNWDNQREELRGWKRYPAGLEWPPPPVPRGVSDNATVCLAPLYEQQKGLRFRGRIRFHNLSRVELGALIWASTFGGERYFHRLGLGKAFGWGQVCFTFGTAMLRPNDPGEPAPTTDDCLNEFTAAMEKWADSKKIPGGWRNSVQIRRLLAMANPELGKKRGETHLRSMNLNIGGQNDFQKAKNAGAILPEYTDPEEHWEARVVPSNVVKGGSRQQAQPAAPGAFQEGDQVRWLDEALDGVVLADEQNGEVEVRLSDGMIERIPVAELRRI